MYIWEIIFNDIIINNFNFRLTNNKGNRKHPKRLYFSSHDYYLFFLNLSDACPPPPPPSLSSNDAKTANEFHNDGDNNKNGNKNSLSQQPIIYSVAPHLQGHYKNSDTFTKANSKRIVKQMISTTGLIDLTQVKEVRPYKNVGENSGDDSHCFELVMENGAITILQVLLSP